MSAAGDAVLGGAALGRGDDVLVLGGDPALVFGVHGRIGDGWVYAVDAHVDELEALLDAAHAEGIAGVAYLVGDANVLPLPDASVAAAVGAPLAGLPDPTEAARELYRVLRPGGRLSIDAADEDADTALRAAGFVDVSLVESSDGRRLTAVKR